MKRSVRFCMIFCMSVLPALSQDEEAYASRTLDSARKGIELMYDLDYAGAQEIFDQLKKSHPDSPVGYGMTAINAWNQMNFAARNLAVYEYGIPTPIGKEVPASQSITREQENFQDANQALQTFCEKLLQKNPQNAEALYFKGMSYENLSIQTATYDRKWGRVIKYAKEAAKIHSEALSLDPSLVDAKISKAVPDYVIGSFGWFLRGLAWMRYQMKGDKEGAVENLKEVAENGRYRATDARATLAFLEAWKGDPRIAVSILNDLQKKHPRSFLIDISLAVAYMNAAKDAKSAIRVYSELLDNMSSKAPGIYAGEIHFRIANCYVQLRDYSLALDQFQKALDTEHRNAETEILAFYNMASIYEERGEKEKAKDCYQRAAAYSGPTELIEDEIKRAKKKIR